VEHRVLTMSTESPPNGRAETTTLDAEFDDQATTGIEAETIPTEASTDLELDQVFEILKNQRRRYVLKYLNEVEKEVSMSDLAEEIAAWENDKPVSQLSSSERKRVYVGLYQCHLPKMDSMGVVEFNKPRGRIDRGENADVFDDYIRTEGEPEDPPWYRIHGAVAAGSVAVFAVALLAQFYVTAPVVAMAGLLVVAGNAGCSAAHLQWQRHQDDDEN